MVSSMNVRGLAPMPCTRSTGPATPALVTGEPKSHAVGGPVLELLAGR